ncbi:MAG: FmdB family zinc ribbon protein [Planctomycetota bacterium]
MPVYDYECKECGATFSKQESFEQHERRRNVKCPECGARKTRQLVSTAYVQTAKKS